MSPLRRRTLLQGAGTLALVGAGAGCLDEAPGEDDEDEDGYEYVRGNDVVDYPGMVGGVASVGPEERSIEYDDPEVTFGINAGFRGEEAAESELRVGRDLSGETMAGFLAPVYDDADETFRYHVFVNGAFVEFAMWQILVAGAEQSGAEHYRDASFEHYEGSVYGTVVAPEAGEALVVADAGPDELEAGSDGDASGLAIFRQSDPATPQRDDEVRTTAPNAQFDFQYDAAAEELAVRHVGGDAFEAEDVSFHGSDDLDVASDFEGTVTAGQAATLAVSSASSVRLVWTSPEGDHSATLARWQGPDA